ncbi:MAG TPA: hypothetical protein VLF91_01810 [Candidatus Saccharimonadales bacterium]|nr:hypothetical protein [Candidatus Saccharimonadales bacterium]
MRATSTLPSKWGGVGYIETHARGYTYDCGAQRALRGYIVFVSIIMLSTVSATWSAFGGIHGSVASD